MSGTDETLPARSRRFFARPRDGESTDEFVQRFLDGILVLVEEHRRYGDGDAS